MLPADQALLLQIMAACGLAIKLLLLSTLVRLMGEKWLLMFGLAVYALQVSIPMTSPSYIMRGKSSLQHTVKACSGMLRML